MSDAHLPDNLDDWPKDPFALFGVPRSINQRELRRVYTRLIREFKPERLPAHFRRIREAYETLHRYAAWNDADAADEERAGEVEDTSDLRDQPEPEAAPMPRRLEPDECWRWALAGETQRAYDALRELHLERSCQPDLLLRLYWLLIVNPDLDPARTPRNWLVEGLRTCAQHHRLFEQYSNEVAGDPNEVLHDRFVNLLELVQGPLLTQLLECRWQALARLELWTVIHNDLDAYRDKVCRQDESDWLRILLSLAGKCFHIQPLSPHSVFQKCQKQIEKIGHLSLAHGSLFDSAEALIQLSRESANLAPGIVLEVAAHVLADRMEEAVLALEPFLTLACQSPKEALNLLDQTVAVAPNLMSEFSRAISWLSWTSSRDNSSEHTKEIAEHAIYAILDSPIKHKKYAKARHEILAYCCKEGLRPEQMIQWLQEQSKAPSNLAQRLASDLPLQCTCTAFRLGWACQSAM